MSAPSVTVVSPGELQGAKFCHWADLLTHTLNLFMIICCKFLHAGLNHFFMLNSTEHDLNIMHINVKIARIEIKFMLKGKRS